MAGTSPITGRLGASLDDLSKADVPSIQRRRPSWASITTRIALPESQASSILDGQLSVEESRNVRHGGHRAKDATTFQNSNVVVEAKVLPRAGTRSPGSPKRTDNEGNESAERAPPLPPRSEMESTVRPSISQEGT